MAQGKPSNPLLSLIGEVLPLGWPELAAVGDEPPRGRAKRRGAAEAFFLAIVFGALPVHAATMEEGAGTYKTQAIQEIAQSLTDAKEMSARLDSGDFDAARKEWKEAREGWERSEVFTGEFFADLDAAIDAWPDAKEGFHAIEAQLFAKGDAAAIKPMAKTLVENLAMFKAELGDAALTPQGLLNGATKLAYEIGENKAAGGESPWSGNSLSDMRYNVQGIEAVYRMVFESALKANDGKLAADIDARIEALESLLKASDLKSLDQDKVRETGEDLAVAFQAAGPRLGLAKPSLED